MPETATAKPGRRTPDYVTLGVVAALGIGFFISQWLMLDALTQRMDALESGLMQQCSRCEQPIFAPPAAQPAAQPKAPPKPDTTAAPAATAEPTATAAATAAPAPKK